MTKDAEVDGCGLVGCRNFFFFQAEDGIRDHCVTGVQTCALPICWKFVNEALAKMTSRNEIGSRLNDETMSPCDESQSRKSVV